jgi:hypothetical protein
MVNNAQHNQFLVAKRLELIASHMRNTDDKTTEIFDVVRGLARHNRQSARAPSGGAEVSSGKCGSILSYQSPCFADDYIYSYVFDWSKRRNRVALLNHVWPRSTVPSKDQDMHQHKLQPHVVGILEVKKGRRTHEFRLQVEKSCYWS